MNKMKCKRKCKCQGKCAFSKRNNKGCPCNSREPLLSNNDNNSQNNERKKDNV